jgi:hypothetical protein
MSSPNHSAAKMRRTRRIASAANRIQVFEF